MRLVIFGATGPTGRRLVERALAEGHEVRAFVRDASKLAASHERLTVVEGDAFDPESVEGAVSGAEAVISVLGGEPSNPLKARGPPEPNGPASAGARNIVRAMWKHSVGILLPGLAGAYTGRMCTPIISCRSARHRSLQSV